MRSNKQLIIKIISLYKIFLAFFNLYFLSSLFNVFGFFLFSQAVRRFSEMKINILYCKYLIWKQYLTHRRANSLLASRTRHTCRYFSSSSLCCSLASSIFFAFSSMSLFKGQLISKCPKYQQKIFLRFLSCQNRVYLLPNRK